MAREWRRKPLKSLKMDSESAGSLLLTSRIGQANSRTSATGRQSAIEDSGREISNAAGPAEAPRLERAISALGLRTTWKAN
jgi:hypothetical protein